MIRLPLLHQPGTLRAASGRHLAGLVATGVLCACGGGASPDTPDPYAKPPAPPANSWPHYGGGLDGSRHATATLITPRNVTKLREAWRFRTGDATGIDPPFGKTSYFKATPILVDDKLVFPTGFGRVFALDPVSGERLWRFDAGVELSVGYSEMYTSRGVAAWFDAARSGHCAKRLFMGTLDARLVAIDAADGTRCTAFGTGGQVDLSDGIERYRKADYSVTSPPIVVGDVVIVGSSVGDNGGVALESGVVRAFDVRTGQKRWAFDPIPRSPGDPGWDDWQPTAARTTGAANVWTVMAADESRNLVFLPTTSPSPDFYGGERTGDNRHANSLVALEATTGKLVWAYQAVRHDLWDYDLAAQPLLVDIDVDGVHRAAVVLATKMGFVFVLDRLTGEPLWPVSERRVPASDVPGEQAAPTQPFPSIGLHAVDSGAMTRWHRDPEHAGRCGAMLAGVRYDGIYTPPSLEGTLLYPGNAGGVNWGSMAADPQRRLAFVAINRLPTVVRLVPRASFETLARAGILNGVEAQFTEQSGTPYGMARFDVYDRDTGLPCHRGPWASLVALDLDNGRVAWEKPAGVAPGLDRGSEAADWGYYVKGGPLSVAGGLVFLATPFDFMLRGYDVATGRVAWSAPLPAEPHATPMSYRVGATQYVVIAAGGALAGGEGRGDYVIAFGLTDE